MPSWYKLMKKRAGSGPVIPVWRIPGSRILIFTPPGSRIPDPGSKNSHKRERWKKICCQNFFCSHKFHKIPNYFSFEVLKKKIWVNFQRIIELFTQKIVNKLSKIWDWDPGSEIRDQEKPLQDPGSRGHKGTGSATLRNPVERVRGSGTLGLPYTESFLCSGLLLGGGVPSGGD